MVLFTSYLLIFVSIDDAISVRNRLKYYLFPNREILLGAGRLLPVPPFSDASLHAIQRLDLRNVELSGSMTTVDRALPVRE